MSSCGSPRDEFLLTAAEPNLAYFDGLIGRLDVAIEEVSDAWAVLAVQGPRSRDILAAADPRRRRAAATSAWPRRRSARSRSTSRGPGSPATSGSSCGSRPRDALTVWDAVWAASRGQGVIPFGLTALYMARIEAGLVLLDVDFHTAASPGPTTTGPPRSSSGSAGWSATSTTDEREFIGRDAIRRELADKTSRWKLSGLVVDWRDYDRIYDEAGLIPPKDHTPVQDEYYVYDDDLNQLGYATSQMYSPMLQRHIALARVPLDRRRRARA